MKVKNLQNTLVSIIVPIFNVKAYLKECLLSFINQSYKNLDIILVDDGSDDESLEIALEFASKDERILVLSKPNSGQASARNLGLEFIKGSALREFLESESFIQKNNDFNSNENSSIQSFLKTHTFDKITKEISHTEIQKHFIKIASNFIKTDLENINELLVQNLPSRIIHFVDSDDYIKPDCIELCVKNMLEKNLEILVHNLVEFHESAKEFKNKPKLPTLKKLNKDEYNSGLELLSENKIYDFYFAWQGSFKSEILNRYNLRFTHAIFHEDHDFGTILFALAKKIAYINEALYVYRVRVASTMSGQKVKQMPQKMPSFLLELKPYFKDYQSLRAYFKAYCFVRLALVIEDFYNQMSLQDENFKLKFKTFFTLSTLTYLKIFKISLQNDPLDIKAFLAKFKLSKATILSHFFKDLHRQPKKLKFISNLKYLLKKDNQ
ncbi:glycosyl transferase family A [Campylobacter sp. MIT 12-5580]|nr:glycosyl transferase family A [Campylobacter sp. MIT 12-5580]